MKERHLLARWWPDGIIYHSGLSEIYLDVAEIDKEVIRTRKKKYFMSKNPERLKLLPKTDAYSYTSKENMILFFRCLPRALCSFSSADKRISFQLIKSKNERSGVVVQNVSQCTMLLDSAFKNYWQRFSSS